MPVEQSNRHRRAADKFIALAFVTAIVIFFAIIHFTGRGSKDQEPESGSTAVADQQQTMPDQGPAQGNLQDQPVSRNDYALRERRTDDIGRAADQAAQAADDANAAAADAAKEAAAAEREAVRNDQPPSDEDKYAPH